MVYTVMPEQPQAPTRAPSLPATAYGRHLSLTLRAALAARPTLFDAGEHALVAALAAAPAAVGDIAARLVFRRREPADEASLGVADEALAGAAAMGWVERSGGSARATPSVRALVRAGIVAAFGDDREDLSLFPRLALARLALPPGSPCARAIAAELAGLEPGTLPSGPTPTALRTRAALDAYLVARDARAAGPGEEALALALAAVEAAAGEPLDLVGHHLDAVRHWAALLSECRSALPAADPRHTRILRALRRAPLPPRQARGLWEQVWRRGSARGRRFIAGHLAGFALWSEGERARWQARAKTPGSARAAAGAWRAARLSAWLERDAGGAVLAQGENVEAHALRRLAAQGWSGVHAEGGFWTALAALLLRDVVLAPVPGAWIAPLQALPLDWGRWGFATRRVVLLDARAERIVRDPVAALADAYAAHGGELQASLLDPPPRPAAEAVCRLMPRATLMRLLRRVIADPAAASGLPDLVAWRGDELALWEVKSPNDQPSDAQRAWLAWLDAEGVAAGILRVDAKAPEQASLFAAAPQHDTPPVPLRAVTARARPRRADAGACAALACDGAAVPLATGSRVPCVWPDESMPLAAEPLLPVERWSGRLGDGAVAGWARPALALAAAAIGAVRVERRAGRHVRERRWWPLPPGWVVPALVVEEADADGGVTRRLALLARAAGWLIDADACAVEPVAVPIEAFLAALAGEAPDWRPHPDAEPPRPERAAWSWGFGADLAAQLALLGSSPYRLAFADRPGCVELAVSARQPCLWTASAAGIVRAELEPALEG